MDVYALGLAIETKGAENAKKVLSDIDQKGKQIATTFDRNSSAVSSSFNTIGRRATIAANGIAAMGDIGTSALTRIANATSSVAWGFGPQGAVVAAAGVAAVAITGIFTRARKEMVETDRKARELLRSLSLETGSEKMGALFSGDEFADTEAQRMGIARARARLAALGPAPEAIEGRSGLAVQRHDANKKEREELTEFLTKAEPLYERVAAQVRKLTAAQVEQNDVGNRLDAEGRARDLAKRAGEKAATEGERAAEARRDAAVRNIGFLMEDVTAAIERRQPDAQKAMLDAVSKIDPAEFKSRIGDLLNDPDLFVPEIPSGITTAAQNRLSEEIENWAENLRYQVSTTFGDALAAGFTEAFSGGGIGAGIAAFGRGLLSGLGAIFVQMGQKMIMASSLMIAFQKALAAFSGIAGLGIGIALVGLGAAMGAAAGSGGGRAGGGAGGYGGGYTGSSRGQEEMTKIVLMPNASTNSSQIKPLQPIVFAPTIIGQNDPAAQRQLREMVEKAVRRVA